MKRQSESKSGNLSLTPLAQSVVARSMASLYEIDVPPILKARIDEHQKNLAGLACALLSGGQDAEQVRETIEEVLASFKDELFRTIDALKREADARQA